MSYARLFYHFVWATKQREALITEHNRPAIFACIVHKVGEFKGYVHALNAMSDHVHLVVMVPPTVSLAQFIGQVKGSSSHLASHLPDTDPRVGFAWQDEYGVLSVSERHLPIVVRYVENQQQHHAANDLNAALERFA